MLRQGAYKPVFEDWLFHVLLPFAAYATLAVTAFATRSYLPGTLFGIGAAALLLLFVGIHNAWDAVTYHVFDRLLQPVGGWDMSLCDALVQQGGPMGLLPVGRPQSQPPRPGLTPAARTRLAPPPVPSSPRNKRPEFSAKFSFS